ncbi:antitoxin [Sandarakinorhabdus sp.]|uniref:antitoxin n=1 Tax=Sandarakinorhabdus sp. TaxID=1916663 RepID=UPI00333E7D96
MSRLSIDLSDQQHNSLKALAALEGKSIRQFALERLFPDSEVDGPALAELKALIDQRISAALGGAISTSSFADIVAQELDRA